MVLTELQSKAITILVEKTWKKVNLIIRNFTFVAMIKYSRPYQKKRKPVLKKYRLLFLFVDEDCFYYKAMHYDSRPKNDCLRTKSKNMD